MHQDVEGERPRPLLVPAERAHHVQQDRRRDQRVMHRPEVQTPAKKVKSPHRGQQEQRRDVVARVFRNDCDHYEGNRRDPCDDQERHGRSVIEGILMTQLLVAIAIGVILTATALAADPATQPFADLVLYYDTPTDPSLQAKLEQIDTSLRMKFEMTAE